MLTNKATYGQLAIPPIIDDEQRKKQLPANFSETQPSFDLQQLRVTVRMEGETLLLLRSDLCAKCLELRYCALFAPPSLTAKVTIPASLFTANSPWLTPFAFESAQILADQLNLSAAVSRPSGYGIHMPTLATYQFYLEPHSDCPDCACPPDDSSEHAVFHSQSRAKTSPISYRSTPAVEDERDTRRYINPTCGAFGGSTTRNRIHPYNAQAVGSFRDSRARHRIMWSGHKSSFQSSVLTGLYEAFERHAGLAPRAKRSSVCDTFAHLAHEALDPRTLGLYSDSYYASSNDLIPFSEDLPLHWVWGYSLTENRPILVPEQFAYYGFDAQRQPRIIHDNSNGCASGCCLEDAILHSLLELIERDAFVIHWYARIAPPKLDLDSITDPELHSLIQRLRRSDFEIFLLDTRLDVPIPSVTALAIRRDRGLGTLSLAAGCSFDPESAIASALGEVASHYVGLEDRVRHAESRLRPAVTNMALVQTMEDHSLFYGFPEALQQTDFLLSNNTVRSVKDSYSDWTEQLPRGSDLRDDIAYCLSLLKQAGLPQVVVVNQTSPEGLGFGIHTVRVIVPGLMPLDFGFERSRGASLPRMYSVPVDLGHRSTPGTAADLNYVPHPFP